MTEKSSILFNRENKASSYCVIPPNKTELDIIRFFIVDLGRCEQAPAKDVKKRNQARANWIVPISSLQQKNSGLGMPRVFSEKHTAFDSLKEPTFCKSSLIYDSKDWA